MKYSDGTPVSLGDKVKLSSGQHGKVVCSMDTDKFTKDYPKDEWGYLKSGVLIKADSGELFHYAEADEDLELISAARKSKTPQTQK